MARSYKGRRGSRRRGGLLVREANVQRGVKSNSLFCVPVRADAGFIYNDGTSAQTKQWQSAIVYSDGSAMVVYRKGSTATTEYPLRHDQTIANFSGNVQTLCGDNRMVRIASMVVASQSPFKVFVKNSSGGTTVYQIQGQKPTKITFGVNDVVGNPALLNQEALRNGVLVGVIDTENEVDVSLNIVYDSQQDDLTGSTTNS